MGNFYLPHEVVTKHKITQLANLFEDGVKGKQDAYEFLHEARQKLELSETEAEQTNACLIAVYEKLQELEAKGINGVWARIIKNAFAPLFVKQFDLIIGNPPWVNWESLPANYRDELKRIYIEYGLFSLSGKEARYGGGKKDLSPLMFYVSIDNLLNSNGKICFVITQSLFKSQGAGDGFRRFQLGDKEKFKVICVDDMVNLQPFDNAANRTSVILAQKNGETVYPITYNFWKKIKPGKILIECTLEEVFNRTKMSLWKAYPIGDIPTGPWITAKGRTVDALRRIIGKSYYSAKEGANNGGLAGVYWIDVIERKDNGSLRIENLWDSGKKKVKAIEYEIEPDCVFPLMRWSDMYKWRYEIKNAIIAPHKLEEFDKPIPEEEMPLHTLEYFRFFEELLLSRALYKRYLEPVEKPFYSIYNVGNHTLSRIKVCWQRMGETLRSVVVDSQSLNSALEIKPILPQETIVFIPLSNLKEAHYICSLMNSSISQLIAKSYSMGKSFASAHILNYIAISKFDQDNKIHLDLANLSVECHKNITLGTDVDDLEEQIDKLAAELWGLTKEELQDIKDSLKELK